MGMQITVHFFQKFKMQTITFHEVEPSPAVSDLKFSCQKEDLKLTAVLKDSEWAYSYNEHRFERDLGGKWNVANHWVAAPGVVT